MAYAIITYTIVVFITIDCGYDLLHDPLSNGVRSAALASRDENCAIRLARFFCLQSKSVSVLDVGCGSGGFVEACAKEITKNWKSHSAYGRPGVFGRRAGGRAGGLGGWALELDLFTNQYFVIPNMF